MSSFNEYYQAYLAEFEGYLQAEVSKWKTQPGVLAESMTYSLLNGGKRVRPVLMLACAKLLGIENKVVLPFALALEMIHTYSLIHDDLPAMDNDDFRRGKPSCHKAFGEDNAILAGDALLNEAYAVCFAQCLKGERFTLAAKYLNEKAGMNGMIVGQSADLYYSKQDSTAFTEEQLAYIHENKTGALLLAPLVIPSILANNKYYFQLEDFGKMIGLLFQITDDILDVVGKFEDLGKSVGKDEKENKLTCVNFFGLEHSKIYADECAKKCHTLLESIDGDTEFLHQLIDYILNRTK